MKVNFIICGTQKGGTTALDVYLRHHPGICMAGVKEVHFFDNEDAFAGGQPDYEQYHAAFNPSPSHKTIGEATPIYMYWHDAPRRIWEYNPNLKLIVLLRNPIARAYSHWNMERSRGAEALSFWDAIRAETLRCRESLPLQHRVYSYLDRGFYVQQLRRLWNYFPKRQVLVLKSAELKNRPYRTLRRVCEFLGVDPLAKMQSIEVNRGAYASSMRTQERDYLRAVFERDIRALERELGWDCSDWLRRGLDRSTIPPYVTLQTRMRRTAYNDFTSLV